MVRVFVHLAHGYLVRAPVAFGALAVDLLRAGPPFGRAEHDHGPARALGEPAPARVSLKALDLGDDRVQRGGHELVHRLRLVALDEVGRVSVAAEELIQLLVADPGQNGRVGDLVAVEIQDWQHRAVGRWVQEFVRVPARCKRSSFSLAVADDTGDDQVGVVEGGPIGVRESVAELAALVDRAGRLRRYMAGNAARERKLGEEALHALLARGDVRVDLAVGALKVGVRDQGRPAVAGAGDVDHVEVVLLDHPVQLNVDKVQTRRSPPVAQEPGLDVLLA